MLTPYTTITEEVTESTAISGGALDNISAQSRRAAVCAVPAADTARDARWEGARQQDRIRESATGKQKCVALHCN